MTVLLLLQGTQGHIPRLTLYDDVEESVEEENGIYTQYI
jgi:hypothetical protein